MVLQRGHPQPRLRNADRQFWICASRWFASWRNSLLIVNCEAQNGAEVASTAKWPFRESGLKDAKRPV
jgi:hypothetical protein